MIPEPGNTDLNFVDFVILLGVVQGIMLCITSLFRKGRKEKFKAALFFLLTCIILEIFLNRTGYMYFTIQLVDFSEPLQFAIPPDFAQLVQQFIMSGSFPFHHVMHIVINFGFIFGGRQVKWNKKQRVNDKWYKMQAPFFEFNLRINTQNQQVNQWWNSELKRL